jgi:hypothetical protein
VVSYFWQYLLSLTVYFCVLVTVSHLVSGKSSSNKHLLKCVSYKVRHLKMILFWLFAINMQVAIILISNILNLFCYLLLVTLSILPYMYDYINLTEQRLPCSMLIKEVMNYVEFQSESVQHMKMKEPILPISASKSSGLFL